MLESASTCEHCNKKLATPIGLRRHINSMHARTEMYVCGCGRTFLDPAGRSRCRTSHLKSFGCPIGPCTYRSVRKDSVKQHIRRRHAGVPEPPIRTLVPIVYEPPKKKRSSVKTEDTTDPSPSPVPTPGPYETQPSMASQIDWTLVPPYPPPLPMIPYPGYPQWS